MASLQSEPFDTRAELERLHRESYAWALNCCGRDADVAEDVLHDVYVSVLEGRARFDGRASFKTWLFGVIRLAAARQRRGSLLRRLLLSRHAARLQIAAMPTSPAEALCRAEMCSRLADALARLPRRQREVLLLVFYHDLSISEAAGVMGVSVGTARTHYHRGKETLRKLLKLETD